MFAGARKARKGRREGEEGEKKEEEKKEEWQKDEREEEERRMSHVKETTVFNLGRYTDNDEGTGESIVAESSLIRGAAKLQFCGSIHHFFP